MKLRSIIGMIMALGSVVVWSNPTFKLIIVLYNETHHERMQEYMVCLQKNKKHELIDTIHVVYDTSRDDNDTLLLKWLKTTGVTISYTDARPTYSFLFELANTYYPHSRIIMSNADIYFNDTLYRLEGYPLTNKFLALTRWNVCPDGEIELFKQYRNGSFDRNDSETSQDVWIFQTPLKEFKDGVIHIGTATCDSLIAYQAHDAGLEVLNPCLTIQCCHLHLSNVRTWDIAQAVKDKPVKGVPWISL